MLSPCIGIFTAVTAAIFLVKVISHCCPGPRLEQALASGVTLPSRAVPDKSGAMLVAVTVLERLVIVKLFDDSPTVKVMFDGLTVIETVSSLPTRTILKLSVWLGL